MLAALASAAAPAAQGGLALVLDPALSGPLGLVAEVRDFREHGVEKIYHLLPEPLKTECKSVAYIIRPHLRLAEQVSAQICAAEKARGKSEGSITYTLFFVPRRSMMCEKVLSDEGVHGLLSVRELPLPLFVLEEDVLSLEHPHSFRECLHDADHSVLYACASTLSRMQAIYGRFPVIRGKGQCAQTVLRMVQQMSAPLDDVDAPPALGSAEAISTSAPHVDERAAAAAAAIRAAVAAEAGVSGGSSGGVGGRGGEGGSVGGGGSSGSGDASVGGAPNPCHLAAMPSITEVLLLDRDVDLVTPLCTELTYEGLIHQVFGIAHGYVDLEPDAIEAKVGGSGGGTSRSSTTKTQKQELNSNDPLYASIRNLNFGELGPLLNRLARGDCSARVPPLPPARALYEIPPAVAPAAHRRERRLRGAPPGTECDADP